MTRGADPRAVVEHRHGHGRVEARRPKRLAKWIEPLRLRHADRASTSPARAPGSSCRDAVVGLDDRQRADRPGDRRHGAPDGRRLRRGGEQGHVGAAAPRRPDRRRAAVQAGAPPRRSAARSRARWRDARRRRRREGGTGSLAAVPGYQVAGKTGTAQKPIPGGYSTSKYVASFVGFVPATRPRLVDPRHGRRAARTRSGAASSRRRRSRDRAVRAAVPRGAAGRPARRAVGGVP